MDPEQLQGAAAMLHEFADAVGRGEVSAFLVARADLGGMPDILQFGFPIAKWGLAKLLDEQIVHQIHQSIMMSSIQAMSPADEEMLADGRAVAL